jgi:tetratricopeptide (TPR) repeat protein
MSQSRLQEAAVLAQGAAPEQARPIIAALLAANPEDSDALTLLGIVEQRGGHHDAALAAFGKARRLDPHNPARLGNHALALKRCGEIDAAIATLEAALALRPGAVVTMTNLAACLIEAGREAEAEPLLREGLAAQPQHADAWSNLGIVLARSGDAAGAIAAYDRALALRPGHLETRLNLIDAVASQDPARAADLARAILAVHPGHPRAANQLGLLLEQAGDRAGARKVFEAALDRGGLNHPVGINLTRLYIETGEPRLALDLADRLLAALPGITTPLALKCAALVRADALEELDALLALDRFVTVTDLDAMPGFASLDAFHDALSEELAAHPSLCFEPEGLVTRGGRQSDDLAGATTPALAALGESARKAIAAYIAAMPDGDHPFARARPAAWSLTLWGTILAPGGEVGAHIHAPNWLSGVYYPALPEAVSDGREGGLALGLLPAALGGGGLRRVVPPQVGRMVLFPSWLWHGTLPFSGPGPRLSLAFDCVPAGIGRAHRLRKTPGQP